MNKNNQASGLSSPHNRYLAAVKFRSRVKRALILGVFVSMVSLVGVLYIKSQSMSTESLNQVETPEATTELGDQNIVAVSMNDDTTSTVADSITIEIPAIDINNTTYSVEGIKEQNELIRFIVEGQDSSLQYYVDLGNGASREVKSDTVFYRYKYAGRFMTYLLLQDGEEKIRVDSQYFEIKKANLADSTQENARKNTSIQLKKIDLKKHKE